jgi:hypothetical protein
MDYNEIFKALTGPGEVDLAGLAGLCGPSSLADVAAALKSYYWTVATDPAIADIAKSRRNDETTNKVSIERRKACAAVGAVGGDAKIAAQATKIWHSVFRPKTLHARRLGVMMAANEERAQEAHVEARAKIAAVYHLKEQEMCYLDYFVRQCLCGLPSPSLRRAVYIWGDLKMTGKTTFAKALACALNGGAAAPESSIAVELQFGQFDRPAALEAVAVVMDEAFVGVNSSRYYSKMKTALTSGVCTVNVKFGEPVTASISRNYIFTSNNPPSSVIDDGRDRRFNCIEFKRRPERMNDQEVQEMAAAYVNGIRPWHDLETESKRDYEGTLQEVPGRRGEQIEDMESLFSSEAFARHVAEMPTSQAAFPSYFRRYLNDYDRGLAVADIDLKDTVRRLFGEPRVTGCRKYYTANELVAKCAMISGTYGKDDINEKDEKHERDERFGSEDGLPY